MRYVFIINPTAGKKDFSIQLSNNISDYFNKRGGHYRTYITQKPGDATALARKAASTSTRDDEVVIFSCGGEGTTFETLNGMIGYPHAVLGIIPFGTANDFIKYFGDEKAFMNIDSQVHGTPMPIDVIKADNLFALNQCSCGMDAMVADNVKKFGSFVTGILAYNISIVYTLFKKFGVDMKISIDGKPLDGVKFLFAVCANAPYYGGGYKSAPTAIPGDGKLEYSIIETVSRLKVLSLLGHYKKGTHIDLKGCKYGSCTTMELESDKPMPVNLDGEIFYKSKIKFEVIHKGTRLMVPSILAQKLDSELGFSQNAPLRFSPVVDREFINK
ncbi:MAG: diacylglycerol kinase family lipid kinase [Oscillospiraceae bacterium]|nr:diacylglycerol kinase family lipid kinase [Oscillospiraceae bacterium]